MAQTEQKDFSAAMIRLQGIEMLGGTLNFPAEQNEPIVVFNFNLNIESKVSAEQKLIFVIISVDIKNEDQSMLCGSLTASCIFQLEEFDKFIKFNIDGTSEIPQQLADVFNTISISTMRGIMFSTFKGTFLHNAFLPIIDPRTFRKVEDKT